MIGFCGFFFIRLILKYFKGFINAYIFLEVLFIKLFQCWEKPLSSASERFASKWNYGATKTQAMQ